MRTSLTPSFILHQRPYRETSLILEIFSREHGRISLVAKGIRRSKKRSPALYQSYRNLDISWSGKGEMGTLTGIEALGPEYKLNGKVMLAAFYLNELLMRLLHKHESHPELFDAYLKALTRLEHGELELITLRYFEKHLLDSLGYGLILDHEVETGGSINPDKRYYYSINRGPCISKPADSGFVEISGNTLLALDKEAFGEQSSLEEVRQLMRITLNGYLGEKPLASRELFRAYVLQKNQADAVVNK